VDLQRLPAGVELCGATYLGNPKARPTFVSVFFRSALHGDDLRRFWDPVLTQAGCTFHEDKSDERWTDLVWRCPSAKGGTVTVLTDVRFELYSIGFLRQ
jgi:hypothetical protein